MSITKKEEVQHRRVGKGSRTCFRCGTHQGLIRRFGLNMCRRCFRETAKKMGFRKYS